MSFQNKEIVIDFNPEEGVSALHMDEFPLSFLGRMKIDRASTIDFNDETQLFDINLKTATRFDVRQVQGKLRIFTYSRGRRKSEPLGDYPAEALGFIGYDEAREYEVAWIQECKKVGVDPLEPEGIEIIQCLRVSGSPQL